MTDRRSEHKCYRCGYCCGGASLRVPKYVDSDLSPAYLDSLATRYGDVYARRYAEENAMAAGDTCPWLTTEPDGIATSCGAYERRSAVCRLHNSNTDCTIGYMVMRQYGRVDEEQNGLG